MSTSVKELRPGMVFVNSEFQSTEMILSITKDASKLNSNVMKVTFMCAGVRGIELITDIAFVDTQLLYSNQFWERVA